MSDRPLTTTSADRVLKDFWPRPGTRIKQYVVDTHRVLDWERKTCPVINNPPHEDNTGAPCRNNGRVRWVDMREHDCCGECEEFAARLSDRDDIRNWTIDRAKQTKSICSDREKLSDQIEPDHSAQKHPFLAMLPKASQR